MKALKDLKKAGIPKQTPEGKLDFHAIRVAFVNFVWDSRATVKEAQTLSLHSSSDLTMNVYDRTHKNRLSEIVEDLADNLKLNEKCVQNVYFSEEAEQRKSATLRNNKELRSSKMVEAAGIEPASEISSS